MQVQWHIQSSVSEDIYVDYNIRYGSDTHASNRSGSPAALLGNRTRTHSISDTANLGYSSSLINCRIISGQMYCVGHFNCYSAVCGAAFYSSRNPVPIRRQQSATAIPAH